MTIKPQDLDAALHQVPFVPFRIVTTERDYVVKERDIRSVGVGKRFASVGVRNDEADDNCDDFERVSYERILRLEWIKPSNETKAGQTIGPHEFYAAVKAKPFARLPNLMCR